MSNENTPIIFRRNLIRNSSTFKDQNENLLEKSNTSENPSVFRVIALKLSPHPSIKTRVSALPGIMPSCQEKTILKSYSKQKGNSVKTCYGHYESSKEPQICDSQRTHFKTFEDNEKSLRRPVNSIFKTPINCSNLRKFELPSQMRQLLNKNLPKKLRKIPKKLFTIENDPYHYSNILTSLSSFYDLLNIHFESSSVFPYLTKSLITKDSTKDINSLLLLRSKCSSPLLYREENLSIMPKKVIEVPARTFNDRFQGIPTLCCDFFHLEKVVYDSNVVIVNFESIRTRFSLHLRPRVAKILRRLGSYFHIVLVTSDYSTRLNEIKSTIEYEKLKISGIYTVTHEHKKHFNLLDYSQIFIDFKCNFPAKQCIIISHHNVIDASEVNQEDIIGNKIGFGIKFNSDKVPVVSSDFNATPLQILLPHPNSQLEAKLLNQIAKYLESHLSDMIVTRLCFDFHEFFTRSKLSVIESDMPNQALGSFVETLWNTKSMNSYIYNKYRLGISNYFII